MSFDRFVAVGVKYQIFSKRKQKIFHDGISHLVFLLKLWLRPIRNFQKSLAKNFDDLKENWREIKKNLKKRFFF